jgi:hypothetical protein
MVPVSHQKRDKRPVEFAPPGCRRIGHRRVVCSSRLACDRKNQAGQRRTQFAVETALGCSIKAKLTDVVGERNRCSSRRAQVGELSYYRRRRRQAQANRCRSAFDRRR